jgi:hypothetical protein
MRDVFWRSCRGDVEAEAKMDGGGKAEGSSCVEVEVVEVEKQEGRRMDEG